MRLDLFVLCVSLIISACSITGKVKETWSQEGKLSTFSSLAIEVNSPKKEWQKYSQDLARVVQEDLKNEQVFQSVVAKGDRTTAAKGSELLMKLTLSEISTGNQNAKLVLGMGDAEIVAEGQLIDSSSNKVVARFTAHGNSRNKSETSVGGINVTRLDGYGEDMLAKAMHAMAEHLAAYLREKR